MSDIDLVVKIGGSTLGSHDTTIRDLIELQKQGYKIVVVHGGGNVISDWMSKQSGTIRTQLLKIGAIVIRNTRRIKVHLSSAHPAREIFETVHRKLQLVG